MGSLLAFFVGIVMVDLLNALHSGGGSQLNAYHSNHPQEHI